MIKLILRKLPLVLFIYSKLRGDLREIVFADMERWRVESGSPESTGCELFQIIFKKYPEFRTLFYYRLHASGELFIRRIWYQLIQSLYPGQINLIIDMDQKNIGKGLRIQHGFSTIITTESIGENCWINQQVTIGYTNKTDRPTIGNNVTISAGAKVLGKIIIGDNVIVGANAVVLKDVPSNCTVAGVPARIIRRDGKRVDEKL